MITTIVSFIIVFGILVTVHEFGHYYVAKKSGILVREFSIGMGPKLFFTRHNGTAYTIRWLPIGGYVRLAGAEDDEDDIKPGTPVSLILNDQDQVTKINLGNQPSLGGIPIEITKIDLVDDLFIEGYENGDEDTTKRYRVDHDALVVQEDGVALQIAPRDVQFQSATLWRRFMTNIAGPFMNFILGIIVFTIIGFMQGGVPSNSNQVNPLPTDSVARSAGIKDGDRITSVAGVTVSNWAEMTTQIQKHPDQKVTLGIEHESKTKKVTLNIDSQKNRGKSIGKIGVQQVMKDSLTDKLLSGFTQTWSLTKQLLTLLGSMFSGHFSLNDLGGPVAIYASTAQATKAGIMGVLTLLAFLSINLGIVNLIPIPALDGGKLLFNIIEGVIRRPIPQSFETVVNLIGVAFLLILMVLVTWNDFQRFFIR